MAALYIKAYRVPDDGIFTLSFDLETIIILFVYKLSSSNVKLFIKITEEPAKQPLIPYDIENIEYIVAGSISEMATYCTWPVLVLENHVIAGLCSVARQLIKLSNNMAIRSLLGFKEACLAACSESSIWTRFCEVDVITMTKMLLQNQNHEDGTFHLPQQVLRFEYHLSKPVKMHNIYKVARQTGEDKHLNSSVAIKDLDLKHHFGEGMTMTLADIILYPCFKIFFSISPVEMFKEKVQLTTEWMERINKAGVPKLLWKLPDLGKVVNSVAVPAFVEQSLYTSDSNRYNPQKRVYTKQADIEAVLKQFAQASCNTLIPFGYDVDFKWSEIPLEANPNGGALPEKRAARKSEQLGNLAKAVLKLAANEVYTIVDFCSGSGHVGILLAVLLPKCQIILVENKEQSLIRAQQRIAKLNLHNVAVVQSNLDYFSCNFDVGVALHACGVATDLVLDKCLKSRAHFVICPCCYGGVKNCISVQYPRSEHYKNLKIRYEDYLVLAHAADQTHDADNAKTVQGYLCMDLVDTDRQKYAEAGGYEVHLGKLQPTHCTNKNNLLVGVCKDK